MNEGENSAVPQKPVFSSPNTNLDSVNVTSANSDTSSRSRLGFNSRKYNSSAASRSSGAAFAGAPEFFNEAAGDIVLEAEPRKGGRRKAAIVVGIVLIVFVLLAIAIIPTVLSNKSGDVLTEEEIKNNVNKNSVLLVSDFESTIEDIVKGRIDGEDVVSESFRESFKANYDAYEGIATLLAKKQIIPNATSDGNSRLADVSNKMNIMLPKYKSLVGRYEIFYNRVNGIKDDGALDSDAEKIFASIEKSNIKIKEISAQISSQCSEDTDECVLLYKEVDSYADSIEKYEKTLMSEFVVAGDYSLYVNNYVADDLIHILPLIDNSSELSK